MKFFRSRVFIVSCCLVLAVAGLAGAGVAGWIDYQPLLSRVPFIRTIVDHDAGSDAAAAAAAAAYDALKQENESLRKQVEALQQEAVLGSGLQIGAGAGSVGGTGISGGSTGAGDSLADSLAADQEARKKLYQDLAEYYAGMRPASAVAILGNQDPEMVAEVLHEMDKEQAGQLLQAMDPALAAKILGIIADIESGAGL